MARSESRKMTDEYGDPGMFIRRQPLLLLIAVLTLSGGLRQAHAAMCLPEIEARPKIALVLGGGGARGAAHIGVIRALEELRVPVDFIAGTSMGALVGGLHATGMSADDLTEVMNNVDWDEMFTDKVNRLDRPFRRKRDDDLGLYAAKIGLSEGSSRLPRGAVAGQKIEFLLETLVGSREREGDFDDLPIPFRAVAADILTAEVVVMDSGSLAVAMRSSMALPAVFDPVEYDDRLLVDGGVLMNVPVSVGKDSGADVIIAVDVGSPLAPKEDVQNILQILYQLTGVVTVVNSRQQVALLGDDDFLFFPPIDDKITTASFARAAGAIPAGYSEAMKHRSGLSRLTISEDAWQQRQAAIKLCVDGPPIIDFVRVNNQSRFSDEAIDRRLTIATGQELDLESLQQQLQNVYSLGFLQSVTYKIVEEGELTGVQIDVLPDSRGTAFFEYGLGISSSNYSSNFNIRLGYLKTDVGRNGGEFRGLAQIGQDLGGMMELYMPLSSSLKYVFVPRIAAERTDVNVFDDNGNRLAQMDIKEFVAQLGIGREFGNNALIMTGIRSGSGNVDIGIGDPGFPAFDFERGEYFVRAQYDSQDHRYFPGLGSLAKVEFRWSTPSLGADQEFEQISTVYLHAWTAGRHSFMAGTEIDVSSDDAIPVQSLYRAGGFPRMSGFEYNELLGENFGMLITGYRYKMLEGSFFPGYLGGTIEYGNVHADSADLFSDPILNGSIYLGIDSLLGPLYLGVGFGEGGRRVPFLSIGSIFARDSLVR